MWSEKKHGLSTEPVPVSAYVGSLKNLRDLKDDRLTFPDLHDVCTRREERLKVRNLCSGAYRGTSLIRKTHLPRITIGL